MMKKALSFALLVLSKFYGDSFLLTSTPRSNEFLDAASHPGEAMMLQLPQPAAIFAAATDAMGGEQRLSAIKNFKASADCTSPQGDYRTEIISARGDRLVFKQRWPGQDSSTIFVNGKYAWVKNEKTGKVAPVSKTLMAVVRGHEFQMIALAPVDRYRNPLVEGYEEFAGTRCVKVRVTDEIGNPLHLFFRTDSHLMAGFSSKKPTEDGVIHVVFKQWMTVGERLKLPSLVVVTDGSSEFVLRFGSIILNEADEEMFRVPKEIEAAK